MIRIGVDLGGTKIEAIALDDAGRVLIRRRIASPSHDYAQIIAAVRGLVDALEGDLGMHASVGVGTPGAISSVTGRIKNANSTQLNDRPSPKTWRARSAARSGSTTTPTASHCRKRATAREPAGAWCSA
jgi:predicted NBD/HSP70 family sugar kinase